MKSNLFFAMEVHAPWPLQYPQGRVLQEKNRHLTLAFIGQTENELIPFPIPTFQMGFVGRFDSCVFLPRAHPRVAAWNIQWLENVEVLMEYRKSLISWLRGKNILVKEHPEFLSHVTIARAPFDLKEWKHQFLPMPLYVSSVQLFKSLGFSEYESISSYPLILPFEEIEHTADRAFLVRGRDMNHLYQHALVALAFHFPELLDFLAEVPTLKSIQEVVKTLNQTIFFADKEVGCPYKAVSHHGKMFERDSYIEWEMIIDV
jgi:2'-5' RNA ligase